MTVIDPRSGMSKSDVRDLTTILNAVHRLSARANKRKRGSTPRTPHLDKHITWGDLENRYSEIYRLALRTRDLA